MLISNKGKGDVKYKDYYAGAYINEDQLVVCVTDAADIPKDVDGDEYRIVKNSYNEMDEIVEKIGDRYSEIYGKDSNNTEEDVLLSSIAGFGIDEEQNLVEVDIMELDEKKEKMFHKLFGKYNCVKLQNAEGKIKDCVSYKLERAIFVITRKEGINVYCKKGSMGYRAYRNTASGERKYGFVTCGHDFKVGVTSFKTSAKVLNTKYTYTINGVKFTNLTKTENIR